MPNRAFRDGEFLGHVGLIPDITERKRAEKSIREAQEFAQSTIDALTAHVCVLNDAGTIIAVNKAWRDFAASNAGVSNGDLARGPTYLTACDRASGPNAGEGAKVAAGIRAVLAGRRKPRLSTRVTHPAKSDGLLPG